MINETRKILNKPLLPITATCVRVPVKNCHSESINVEFKTNFDIYDVKMLLQNSPGIVLVDDIDKNYIDVTIDVSGFDEELIMSELITLQEYDRKPIYFDDGWETISGFISYFLYNETDKYVSLSVPVPNIIKLLEKTNSKNATN